MRVLLVLWVFLALFFSSFSLGECKEEEKRMFCSLVAEYAQLIMTLRQQGETKQEVFSRVKPKDPRLRNLVTKVIEEAYRVPVYETTNAKDAAEKRFARAMEKKCLQSWAFD